jgi:hypothetical protein
MELLDEAAERTQLSIGARLRRLRATAPVLAQGALAAGIAWLLAHEVIGHPKPFFAPIAAVICLGVTLGQRRSRAIEMALGVAIGIGVADLVASVIGHGAWQLVLIVLAASALAVLLGSGPMLINQAAASAILIVTVPAQTAGAHGGSRFVDALIGGGVALAIASVTPVNAVRLVRNAAEPVLVELEGVLRDVAAALDARSLRQTELALVRARRIDTYGDRFREALDIGRETSRTTLPGRTQRGQVALYAAAAGQLDLAVRNVRVLVRGTSRAIELGEVVPPEVSAALRDLADAVCGMRDAIGEPRRGDEAREAAIRAAGRATLALEQTANLSVSVIVGQIRSTAVDLLRGLGVDRDEAQQVVREAARELG